MQNARHRSSGDRGVALLIALLVTTLLMVVVFEFAYGTRVSLRAAVNFRNGQRAEFLARSGVTVAGKLLGDHLKNGKLQENLEQREWQLVPIISGGDTELRVRWEDEAGKINMANVSTGQPSLERLERLFGIKQIDLARLDQLKELKSVRLVSDLHKVMSDEEYRKIQECETDHACVTVYGSDKININTAPPEVLQSLGLSESVASMIKDRREREPFDTREKINTFPGIDTTTAGMLDLTSNIFFVQSYATVGGYTKQAEAVIQRNPGGFTILSWRIL
jgi:type II secretory pathway component PulK